jgi:hypothetical protein
VKLSVANDESFVYFLLEHGQAVVPSVSFRAIQILLDTDRTAHTGCQTLPAGFGAEFSITVDVYPNGTFQGFLGDARDCASSSFDFPGALTAGVDGRFFEASVPLDTLRSLTPGSTGFRVAIPRWSPSTTFSRRTRDPRPGREWRVGRGLHVVREGARPDRARLTPGSRAPVR